MRIALVSAFVFDNSIGGVENHIRFLGKALKARGHEIAIFKPTFDVGDTTQARVDELDVVTVPLGQSDYIVRASAPFRGSRFLGLGWAFLAKIAYSIRPGPIVKAIRAWKPDVVWQHDLSSSWRATRKLAEFYPVVLTNHTGEYLFLRRLPFSRRILRTVLAHYSRVVGPSAELTPDFLPHAVAIPNGVDTRVFCPLEPAERARRRIALFGSDDQFVVLCPRRWAPTKGVYYFAKALALLDRQSSGRILAVFAGDSYPGYPRYKARVEGLLKGLRLRCLRLGAPDVYALKEYYQGADLVVIPSLMEAISLAALEAMACGTPVLATRVGGMSEVVKPDDTGYLVPPKDAGALAKAVLQAMHDPARERLSTKGVELVRNEYDWTWIAARTELVLADAVRGSTRDGVPALAELGR